MNSLEGEPITEHINTLQDLVEYAAECFETVTPRWVADTKGIKWLVIDHPSGQYWFWADGTVMQVL